MKTQNSKKLRLSKKTITQIEQVALSNLKGKSLPASAPKGYSAQISQCGNLICY
ncbi:hypothetical protein [Kordia sp.]|uniref:hypothetical protein n=1 Tax=Kordia sp. TaxID=1965332 RepID=UPI003B5B58A3